MKYMNVARRFNARILAPLSAASLFGLSSLALASGGTDYASVLDGLTAGNAVTGILAAGVIVAGLGFAIWATRKVAGFFQGK
jgi:hypothetical protein